MPDMLSIGASSLLAYQQALATVSNNIANANTPGYSRQTTALQAQAGSPTGAGTFGAGVSAVSVSRQQSPFATSSLWSATSASAATAAVAAASTQIDNQLSSQSLSLAQPLSSFFDALDGWATAPTDPASRQAVLGAAQTLATLWNSTDQQLQSIGNNLTQQAGASVSQINTLTQQIADFNNAITVATGQGGGNPPNDLLDQRDAAIGQLAAQIGISTVTNSSGVMSVYTGSGQALVLGAQATQVSLASSPNTGELQLRLGAGAGAVTLPSVAGGTLGGTLDALQNTVAPAQRQLAAVANRLAETVNAVQQAGTDAGGDPGQALFSVATPMVKAALANQSGAQLSAEIKNAINWPAEPIRMQFNNGKWTAVGTITGKSYPALTGGATGASLADIGTATGLSISVNGTPQNGDTFTIDNRTSGLNVALTQPGQLAGATPVTATPANTNAGTAVVNRLQVTDPANPDLRAAATVTFPTTSTYSLDGGATTQPFNGTISANGWTLSLNGTPAAGDSFTLAVTGANSADNGMANLLAGLRTQPGADGQSVTQAQSALIANVGSRTARAQGLDQAQTALLSQAQNARDQVSGVSLDEEAANLMRYQQAYQAAAQVMSSAQTLFSSLLRAVGG
ncbi:MAG: flagellar hook-associated protein FlgK [Nevskiaceae bacterium]|nr:MAG: flagellar hook-associated protein FlgK [Nevskiaceae bacterium]TBR71563.1 MAG: flagellar hook-associated protein FlgK [Nevskiaceae bacterium]